MQHIEGIILAIKKQERIDEQRKVVDERNVECPIGLKHVQGDAKEITEVDSSVTRCTTHVTSFQPQESPTIESGAWMTDDVMNGATVGFIVMVASAVA